MYTTGYQADIVCVIPCTLVIYTLKANIVYDTMYSGNIYTTGYQANIVYDTMYSGNIYTTGYQADIVYDTMYSGNIYTTGYQADIVPHVHIKTSEVMLCIMSVMFKFMYMNIHGHWEVLLSG